MGSLGLVFAACLASLGTPGSARAQEIVAVFTSDTAPYREALAGLRDELGQDLSAQFLTKGEPRVGPATRVVIAFGSKAASRTYPGRTVLIAAMAPGFDDGWSYDSRIALEPEPAVLVARLRELQPKLRRLGALWRTRSLAPYFRRLSTECASVGITLEAAEVPDLEELPARLRGLHGGVDALWLPPDALLLNADSLPIVLSFAKSTRLPLYAPTAGLADKGALASVGPSFRQIGRLAGASAVRALNGEAPGAQLFSGEVEVVVNVAVAAELGVTIPPEALKKVDRVIGR